MIEAFWAPTSVEDALRLKRELGERAAFLAGGTELNASYASSPPSNVISLSGVPLGGVRIENDAFVFPATTTIQDMLEAPKAPAVLVAACRGIVNRNVRNMATIGGHVACNKSCSDIIPALVVLEASLEVLGIDDGKETVVPIMDWVSSGPVPGLIKSVLVPVSAQRLAAIHTFNRSANDMSIVTAAVSVGGSAETVERPIVAVGGVAKRVLRLEALEEELAGGGLPPVAEIAEKVRSHVSPISDLRGSADLKRHLAGVLVARSLHGAMSGGIAR